MENIKENKQQQGRKISTVRDRPMKSIAKTITWRVIASVTTFLIARYIFSSDPAATEKATIVACAEAMIKMVLYFFHERAWNAVRWGRMRVIIRRYNIFRRKVVKRTYIPVEDNND